MADRMKRIIASLLAVTIERVLGLERALTTQD